nr:MAG TPA: hypothetical protein [Caudoviricetes sp.]
MLLTHVTFSFYFFIEVKELVNRFINCLTFLNK